MAGVLFLVGVIGFLVVAHWAFINDQPEARGERGIFAMRPTAVKIEKTGAAVPKWRKTSQRRASKAGWAEKPSGSRAGPKWRGPHREG